MSDYSSNTNNRTVLLLVVGLVLLGLLAVSGVFVYNNTRLYVKNDLPKNNSVIPTSTPYIDFVFNKELDDSSLDIGVSTVDPEIIQGLVVSGSNLRIYLATQNVRFGSAYTIVFDGVRSTDGKVLNGFVYNFTSEYVPLEEQSRQVQEAAVEDVDRDLDSLDIVYKVLPYINRASNYYVDAERSKDGNIQILVKPLTGSVPVSNKSVDEAKDYLMKRDINIDEYIFVVD